MLLLRLGRHAAPLSQDARERDMACGKRGDKMKRNVAAWLVLALLVAAMAMKAWLTTAPDLGPARPGGFDQARAAARLARVLGDQRPHPVDSAADDAVRGRLVAELQAMGLSPRVTDHWACNGD